MTDCVVPEASSEGEFDGADGDGDGKERFWLLCPHQGWSTSLGRGKGVRRTRRLRWSTTDNATGTTTY